MIYAVHISTDEDIVVVERLKRFENESDFNQYSQYCEVYDNGASHYLQRLSVDDYCNLLEAGRKAQTVAYKNLNKEDKV